MFRASCIAVALAQAVLAVPMAPTPCTTITNYLPTNVPEYTSTIYGYNDYSIIVGKDVVYTTRTKSVGANTPAYVKTIVTATRDKTGTIEIGSPVPYVTSTTYGDQEYTSTIGGTIQICYKHTYTTSTSMIPCNVPAYTTTIPAVEQTPGTVVIGQQLPCSMTTMTITSGTAPVATTTVGSGPSSTVRITVPSSCANGGMDYAIWANPFHFSPSNRSFPEFDPSYFQKAPNAGTGVTNVIGYQNTANNYGNYGSLNIYKTKSSLSAQQFTIAHRAYLVGVEAGTYTFTATNSDDFTGLWTGTYAVRDYTRANSRFEQVYSDHANKGVKTYTITLKQGQYVPFRIMYANGGGPANLDYKITSPSGKVVLGCDEQELSPYIVRNFCDGTVPFPAFKPWGSEIY